MSKVKTFVIYHKPYHVFKNEVFEPIQTGADFSGIDLKFLKDNTGDNIAQKNPHYGELTSWYWVWKNWLPVHPEIEYIGFCHYRRFLDVCEPLHLLEYSFRGCHLNDFIPRFDSTSFSEFEILKQLNGYDIALPPCLDFSSFETNFTGTNLRDQFLQAHPKEDFLNAFEIYATIGNKQNLQGFWGGTKFHSGLNFIMRKSLFEDLCNWMFSFLAKLECKCHWATYTKYADIRAPAFLAERYFDLWIYDIKRIKKIKTCPRWMIDGVSSPTDIPWYLSGIKQWALHKLGIHKNNLISNY